MPASPSDPTDGDDVDLTCGHYPQTDDVTSYEFFKDDVSLGDSASDTYRLHTFICFGNVLDIIAIYL